LIGIPDAFSLAGHEIVMLGELVLAFWILEQQVRAFWIEQRSQRSVSCCTGVFGKVLRWGLINH